MTLASGGQRIDARISFSRESLPVEGLHLSRQVSSTGGKTPDYQ